MNIKITYASAKKGFDRKQMLKIWRWPFLAAAICPVIVNLCVGGKAWSVISLWGVYMLWSNVFALNIVGYNRIRQSVKVTIQTGILLLLIEWLLAPIWADFVLPIVGFGALTLAATLFFSDLRRQKANVMPMLVFAVVLMVISALLGWLHSGWIWPVIVMAAVSFSLILACAAIRGRALLRDFEKYFELK